MTYTVTAPYRDYTLRVEGRTTTTVDVDTTEFFLLISDTNYLLISDTHKLYLSDANLGVESPLLHAQHRDYSVTALQVD